MFEPSLFLKHSCSFHTMSAIKEGASGIIRGLHKTARFIQWGPQMLVQNVMIIHQTAVELLKSRAMCWTD